MARKKDLKKPFLTKEDLKESFLKKGGRNPPPPENVNPPPPPPPQKPLVTPLQTQNTEYLNDKKGGKEMKLYHTLDEVAEEIEDIEVCATYTGDEPLGLVVSGDLNCQNIHLDTTVWCSEMEEREWTEDENAYTETIEEFVIRKLETFAHRLLKTMEMVKANKVIKDRQREADKKNKPVGKTVVWKGIRAEVTNTFERDGAVYYTVEDSTGGMRRLRADQVTIVK